MSAPVVAKSYLGHPCTIAPALERFVLPLDESKKKYGDSRLFAQVLARELQSLDDRLGAALDVAQLARDQAQDIDGGEQLHSVLTVNADFMLQTCNVAFDVIGMVLDLLERGNFVKPAQAEDVLP